MRGFYFSKKNFSFPYEMVAYGNVGKYENNLSTEQQRDKYQHVESLKFLSTVTTIKRQESRIQSDH